MSSGRDTLRELAERDKLKLEARRRDAEARTRWHVERFGVYQAGPFDSSREGVDWILAHGVGRKGYEVRPHETWDGILDPKVDGGMARWVALAVVLVAVFGVILYKLQGIHP